MTETQHAKHDLFRLALALIAGGLLGAITDVFGVQSSRLSDVEADRDALQLANSALVLENAALIVKNGVLQARVDYGPNISERQAVYHLLDALEEPAWCKEVIYDTGAPIEPYVNPAFYMDHINTYYTLDYGQRVGYYEGKTDFEVQPPEIAKAFWENDFEVWESKRFRRYREDVEPLDGRTVRLFWKFYHEVDNNEALICGWQVE